MIEGFVPLAGDRSFGEDPAMVGGLGRFRGQSVVVIGTEKGDTTTERVRRNFGMARPEGYRKARRLMEMANRFRLPILTFVDTKLVPTLASTPKREGKPKQSPKALKPACP